MIRRPTATDSGLPLAAFSSALNIADLVQIDIYKALSNGNQDLTETNTYEYDGSGDPLDCSNWTPDPLGVVPYPPGDRNVYADAELDLVGMRIVYTHSYYSGMPPFTGDVVIDSHVISRVEPDGLTP